MPPEVVELPKVNRIMPEQVTAEKVKGYASTVASGLVIAGSMAAFLVWMTGGLSPGSKVQADALTSKVDTMAQGIASIQSRLDALPRPSDFTQLQQQITAIQAQSESRLTLLEHGQIKMQSDIDHMEDHPKPPKPQQQN